MGYIKKGSLTYNLLTILEKSVDGYVRLEDLGHRSYRYTYGYPDVKKSALSKAISRIKNTKYIKEAKLDDGSIFFKLTDHGKLQLLLESDNSQKWDGKWRIVIWDIPEQKRRIRNLFRSNLKKLGFKLLQNSVWVSKRDVYKNLQLYIKEMGLEKWVILIEADKLTRVDILSAVV